MNFLYVYFYFILFFHNSYETIQQVRFKEFLEFYYISIRI